MFLQFNNEYSLTGKLCPYTKIWLRAISTLFQARAKLSWSGAEAFVPEWAQNTRKGNVRDIQQFY